MTTQVKKTSAELDEDWERFRIESDRAIQLAGEYGIVVDVGGWLTIERYAQTYNVTPQEITDWISRGIIPQNCIMDMPELHMIRLVKDQLYKP